MNRIEIRQLVESARRLGLVAPSGFKQDVYGNPTLSDDNPDINYCVAISEGNVVCPGTLSTAPPGASRNLNRSQSFLGRGAAKSRLNVSESNELREDWQASLRR